MSSLLHNSIRNEFSTCCTEFMSLSLILRYPLCIVKSQRLFFTVCLLSDDVKHYCVHLQEFASQVPVMVYFASNWYFFVLFLYRTDTNKVCCYAHPEAPLIEDYRAGDQICSECGLVVGDRYLKIIYIIFMTFQNYQHYFLTKNLRSDHKKSNCCHK